MTDLSLYSSEKLYYRYTLVGLGSRFVAQLIDYLIITAVYAVIAFFAFLTVPRMGLPEEVSVYVYVGIILFSFFLNLLYFILFETIWNGQTPGKRAAGIRVIRSTGEAVTFSNVLVRNILRIVDLLPATYTIGVLTILISKNRQRVGDMVANTVVIREKEIAEPKVFDTTGVNPALAELIKPNIFYVSERDFNLVTNFFTRRNNLSINHANALADDIARKLALKMCIDPPQTGEPVAFLEAVGALFKEKTTDR